MRKNSESVRNMKKIKWILVAALVLSVWGDVSETAKAAEENLALPQQKSILAPSGICKTKSGDMYLSDHNYHVLRKRSASGNYVILAGTEGENGYKDGSAKEALFHSPWDVVSYKNGLAISDTENHVIRFYKGGKVSTIAGSGSVGKKNASGKKASFHRPTGLAVGDKGELYIADTGNHVIRVMDKKGKVSVFAGSKKGCAGGKVKNARFCEPTGLCYYKGALYVADSGNHRICKIKDGKVTTIAGSSKGIEGSSVGKAAKACLSNPQEICWANGKMYIADTGNGAVKLLQNGKVSEIVKAFSQSESTAPVEPCGLMIKGKYLFVGDMFTEELLKIEL